jgi:hypothetical protein
MAGVSLLHKQIITYKYAYKIRYEDMNVEAIVLHKLLSDCMENM